VISLDMVGVAARHGHGCLTGVLGLPIWPLGRVLALAWGFVLGVVPSSPPPSLLRLRTQGFVEEPPDQLGPAR
jgi:hypothetical protein